MIEGVGFVVEEEEEETRQEKAKNFFGVSDGLRREEVRAWSSEATKSFCEAGVKLFEPM